LTPDKRPVFATRFESAGEAGPFVSDQWRRRGLSLIGVPGSTDEERGQNLLLWIDRLAELVASATPGLLLAPDVEVAGPLGRWLRSTTPTRATGTPHVGGEERTIPWPASSMACPPKAGPVLMGIVQLAKSQGATHAKTTRT
jgi:hypothetical protein